MNTCMWIEQVLRNTSVHRIIRGVQILLLGLYTPLISRRRTDGIKY